VTGIIELLVSFDAEQQAMLAGIVISIVVYCGRLIVPSLFADQTNVGKLRRMLRVAILTAFAALLACGTDGITFGCWASQFVIMFLTGQAAHGIVSNVNKAVRNK